MPISAIPASITSHLYVAVIAGGQGTRLFPLSHDKCPKQFCQLDKESTFIQATVKRFTDLGIKPTRVVVITTSKNQANLANEQLGRLGVLSQNIIEIDPNHGYAVAMIKAAEFIGDLDREAIIINTPADQHIVADENFSDTISDAIGSASNGFPTIVGVKVTDLNTVMGCGHAVYDQSDKEKCKLVQSFIEKPDMKIADQIMRNDISACNTGINVWTASSILSAAEHLDYTNTKSISTNNLMDAMSSSLRVAVGTFTWFDCGTLKSLYDISGKTADHKNAKLGKGKIFTHHCRRSLLIVPEGFRLHGAHLEDLGVVINYIEDRIVVLVVDLAFSQVVRELAENFSVNKNLLINNFSTGEENCNNHVSLTAVDNLAVSFVGNISNHAVVAIKNDDGTISIAVSDNNTKK